ncbi:transporter [Lithospermum erythrorhizon]|uniref:Dirigent protein n=1 Tax=Lithospermum erythrorhizon TaxID=34254 RepID=A0AAV3QVN8_LITER
MKKHSLPLVFFSIITLSLATSPGVNLDPNAVEQWLKALPHAKTKLTKLHFHFHDKLNGNRKTSARVAQPNTTTASPTFFGSVFIMDNPLTTEPKPSSKVIGRDQGIYAATSKQEVGLLMTLNFVFTDGLNKGSTLKSNGIATTKTYFFNPTTNVAIIEYHLMVMHYI